MCRKKLLSVFLVLFLSLIYSCKCDQGELNAIEISNNFFFFWFGKKSDFGHYYFFSSHFLLFFLPFVVFSREMYCVLHKKKSTFCKVDKNFKEIFFSFHHSVVLLDTTKEATLEWTSYPYGPQAQRPGVSVLYISNK